MKLKSLLKDIEILEVVNSKNINITNLSLHSKKIEKHGLYFAISGNNYDGNNYMNEAVLNGAVAVVTEVKNDLISVPQIIVKNARLAMSQISKVFFNRPDEKLKIISVVGTNGKTTISTVLYNILKDNGKKVGLIGTNGVYINGLRLKNDFTTPDPIDLFYILEQMVLFGTEYLIMETSAQSIYYQKIDPIEPYIIVFSNISNEHLDFFETMGKYSKVKIDYINKYKNAVKIINSDEKYSKLVKNTHNNIIRYGLSNPADTFALDIEMSLLGIKFICNSLDDVGEITAQFTGEYNLYNLLAVISTLRVMGFCMNDISKSLARVDKVDGRFEIFEAKQGNKIIIDYAHTPDGFEKILSTIKMFAKNRIITLFGCVGYSDKNKRKEMGNVAKKYSDFVIVTSDNYSDEKFDEIFDDIGIGEHFAKIENREEAIGFGINMLTENDLLVCLGKGAEDVQKTKDGNVIYSDIDTVKKYLSGE